jgi:hypothetical protein
MRLTVSRKPNQRWNVSTLERCLRRCQSRDGNPEGTATDVIETEPVTEFDAIWFAPVFAANSQFDVWPRLSAKVASNFHQATNTFLID